MKVPMSRRMFTFVFVAAGLAALPAYSGKDEKHDAAFYQKKFEDWARDISQMQKSDATGAAATDLEMMRTLIGQAQAFVAADKLESVDPLLVRIEMTGHLVMARLDRVS